MQNKDGDQPRNRFGMAVCSDGCRLSEYDGVYWRIGKPFNATVTQAWCPGCGYFMECNGISRSPVEMVDQKE